MRRVEIKRGELTIDSASVVAEENASLSYSCSATVGEM